MSFRDITDPEFWKLNRQKQERIALNYFNEELADSAFYNLPEKHRNQIKRNYLFEELEKPKEPERFSFLGKPEEDQIPQKTYKEGEKVTINVGGEPQRVSFTGADETKTEPSEFADIAEFSVLWDEINEIPPAEWSDVLTAISGIPIGFIENRESQGRLETLTKDVVGNKIDNMSLDEYIASQKKKYPDSYGYWPISREKWKKIKEKQSQAVERKRGWLKDFNDWTGKSETIKDWKKDLYELQDRDVAFFEDPVNSILNTFAEAAPQVELIGETYAATAVPELLTGGVTGGVLGFTVGYANMASIEAGNFIQSCDPLWGKIKKYHTDKGEEVPEAVKHKYRAKLLEYSKKYGKYSGFVEYLGNLLVMRKTAKLPDKVIGKVFNFLGDYSSRVMGETTEEGIQAGLQKTFAGEFKKDLLAMEEFDKYTKDIYETEISEGILQTMQEVFPAMLVTSAGGKALGTIKSHKLQGRTAKEKLMNGLERYSKAVEAGKKTRQKRLKKQIQKTAKKKEITDDVDKILFNIEKERVRKFLNMSVAAYSDAVSKGDSKRAKTLRNTIIQNAKREGLENEVKATLADISSGLLDPKQIKLDKKRQITQDLNNLLDKVENNEDIGEAIQDYRDNYDNIDAIMTTEEMGVIRGWLYKLEAKNAHRDTREKIKVYRGKGGAVKSEGLNVLGSGKYFFTNKESAERYGEEIEETEVPIDDLLIIDGNNYQEIATRVGVNIDELSPQESMEKLNEVGNRIEDYARRKGYKGIYAIDNVKDVDNGWHRFIGVEGGDGTQVVVFGKETEPKKLPDNYRLTKKGTPYKKHGQALNIAKKLSKKGDKNYDVVSWREGYAIREMPEGEAPPAELPERPELKHVRLKGEDRTYIKLPDDINRKEQYPYLDWFLREVGFHKTSDEDFRGFWYGNQPVYSEDGVDMDMITEEAGMVNLPTDTRDFKEGVFKELDKVNRGIRDGKEVEEFEARDRFERGKDFGRDIVEENENLLFKGFEKGNIVFDIKEGVAKGETVRVPVLDISEEKINNKVKEKQAKFEEEQKPKKEGLKKIPFKDPELKRIARKTLNREPLTAKEQKYWEENAEDEIADMVEGVVRKKWGLPKKQKPKVSEVESKAGKQRTFEGMDRVKIPEGKLKSEAPVKEEGELFESAKKRKQEKAQTGMFEEQGEEQKPYEEAKNFENPEEFIESQTPLYHGTVEGLDIKSFNLENVRKGVGNNAFAQGSKGVYLVDDKMAAKYFSRKANQNAIFQNQDLTPKQALEAAPDALLEEKKENVIPVFLDKDIRIKELDHYPTREETETIIRSGKYDAIKFREIGLEGVEDAPLKLAKQITLDTNTVFVFNLDKVKTESQLTDIWEEANDLKDIPFREITEATDQDIKILEGALKKLKNVLVGNKKLIIVDEIPGNEKRVGMYLKGIAYIKKTMGDPYKTLPHEGIHEVMDKLLKDSEKEALLKALDDIGWTVEDFAEKVNEYTNKYGYEINEEGINQTFSGKIRSLVKRIIRAIKRFFRAESSLNKIEDFYDKYLRGEFARRAETETRTDMEILNEAIAAREKKIVPDENIINLQDEIEKAEKQKSDEKLKKDIVEALREVHREMVEKGYEFEPKFTPLLLTVPEEHVGNFMFMNSKKMDYLDGKRLHWYKHADTRQYLVLDEEGKPYTRKTFDSKFERTTYEKAYEDLKLSERNKFEIDNPDEMNMFEYLNRGAEAEGKLARYEQWDKTEGVTAAIIQARAYTKAIYSNTEKVLENPKVIQQFGKTGIKANRLINQMKRFGTGKIQNEIDLMGLEEWLEGKDRVSLEEVKDFVNENKLVVVDVLKEKPGYADKAVTVDDIVDISKSGLAPQWLVEFENGEMILVSEFDAETREEAGELAVKRFGIHADTRKHKRYQLPGGINYMEWLITAPEISKAVSFERYMETMFPNVWGEWWDTVSERSKEIYRRGYNRRRQYTSEHWEEKNVIAHIRANQRLTPGKDNVFFLEEIQSDWAKDIKEKGIAGEIELENIGWEVKPRNRWTLDTNGIRALVVKDIYEETKYDVSVASIGIEEAETLEEAKRLGEDMVRDVLRRKQIENLPPPMPFIGDEYMKLAVKKALRYAAENDFDYMSWTSAEQQVDRWKTAIRQNVDKIEWEKKIDYVTITAYKDGAINFEHPILLEGDTRIEGRRATLEDVLGKKMANKVRQSKEASGEFTGEDLTIGGEGFVEFYNRKIPNFIKKYVKKWGSKVEVIRVKTKEVNEDDPMSVYDAATQQLAVKITPELKEAVLFEGQPMFRVKESKDVTDKMSDKQKELRKKLLAKGHILAKEMGYTEKKAYRKFLKDNFDIESMGNLNIDELGKVIEGMEKIRENEKDKKLQKAQKDLEEVTDSKRLYNAYDKTVIAADPKTDTPYIKRLRNRVKRLSKDTAINTILSLDEALNKTTAETKRAFWNLQMQQRVMQIKNNDFMIEFHNQAKKIYREEKNVFEKVSATRADYENKKFTKKLIDYFETGKTDDNAVRRIGDLYQKYNERFKPHIRAARLIKYLTTGNDSFIGFLDAENSDEVVEATKKVVEILDKVDPVRFGIDEAIDQIIEEMKNYTFGVRETYYPTQHEQTAEEFTQSLVSGAAPVTGRTGQLKTGKAEPDVKAFWYKFNNTIYDNEGLIKLLPRINALRQTLSKEQNRSMDPMYKTIVRQGVGLNIPAKTFRFLFSLGFKGYLLSQKGLGADIRNLLQTLAEIFHLPVRTILKESGKGAGRKLLGLFKGKKQLGEGELQDKFLDAEETEFLRHLSAKGVFAHAMFISGVWSREIPILRKIESFANVLSKHYTATDVLNRKIAVALLKPLQKLVQETELKDYKKLSRKLKINQFHPSTQLALADLFKYDKATFFTEYIRQKVLKVHHQYERSGRSLFMQAKQSRVFSPLMVFPVSTMSKYLESIQNLVGKERTTTDRLQAAEMLFFKSIHDALKVGLYFAMFAGTSLGMYSLFFGDDDDEQRKKVLKSKKTADKIIKFSTYISPPAIANHIISKIKGYPYSNYGLKEMSFGTLPISRITDGISNIFWDLESGRLSPDQFIMKHLISSPKSPIALANWPLIKTLIDGLSAYYNINPNSAPAILVNTLFKEGKLPSKEYLTEIREKLNEEMDKRGFIAYYKRKIEEMMPAEQIQKILFGRETSLRRARNRAVITQTQRKVIWDLMAWEKPGSKNYKKLQEESDKLQEKLDKLNKRVPVRAKVINDDSQYDINMNSKTIDKRLEKLLGKE